MSTEKDTLLRTRIGCSVAVVGFSLLVAFGLWATRPKTEVSEPVAPRLSVELQTATFTNLTVTVETQGVARPLRTIRLTPEVSGRVVEISRNIIEGERIEKNQLLVRIEPKDYETRLSEALASETRLKANLQTIEINDSANKNQLKLAERSSELARKDYERVKQLSEQGQAVSVSVVESAERTLTQAETQVVQLKQAISQTPSLQMEIDSELVAAKARSEQAELQLQRTEIRAPFSGRIVSAMVEKDEYLQAGSMIIELADDSVLELEVPITATDLRKWIPFEEPSSSETGWFAPITPTPVTLTWSESAMDVIWKGELNRIVRFDPTTRTAILAVRVEGKALRSDESGMPLTDGMFCQVLIPGKELTQVVALPRAAVTFDNKCYISVDGKLQTVDVDVARSEGDHVFISSGINPGDQVIVTRLVAPLEGVIIVEATEVP